MESKLVGQLLEVVQKERSRINERRRALEVLEQLLHELEEPEPGPQSAAENAIARAQEAGIWPPAARKPTRRTPAEEIALRGKETTAQFVARTKREAAEDEVERRLAAVPHIPPLGDALATELATGRQEAIKERVRRALTKLLEDANVPLSIQTIMAHMRVKGIEIGGAKPMANLAAHIYATQEFRLLPDGRGWWFRNREPPPRPAA